MGPEGPVAPGTPCGPDGPRAPEGPGAPGVPWSPGGPGGPWMLQLTGESPFWQPLASARYMRLLPFLAQACICGSSPAPYAMPPRNTEPAASMQTPNTTDWGARAAIGGPSGRTRDRSILRVSYPERPGYDLPVQEYVISELDSGERLITERLDHVRSVALGFWIGAGSRDEPDSKAGVTHFIEHLLFKGTRSYSAQEIAEIFDEMGGELNAATSRESTVVYARIPDRHLERALDVMADMVFAPTFADVDAEREVVLEEIAMVEDTPQDLVHDLLAEAVFGSHALGRPVIGRAGVISSVSRRTLSAYHRQTYRAGNIVVAAAGNLEHDHLLPLLERAAHQRVEPPQAGASVRKPLVKQPPPGLRFQRKDTEQYHVCIGATGISRSDRRRFAASVLDAILGGSASSRLFQEIREKRGMAYAVYTFAGQYSDTGQTGVYIGTREENLEPCLAIVGEQIADVAAGNVARRARAREGESQGPHRPRNGVDVEPHEQARQGAHHGHGAALRRPRYRGDRRRGGLGRRRARRGAAGAGAAVRGRHRAERGAVPRRRGARAPGPARAGRRLGGDRHPDTVVRDREAGRAAADVDRRDDPP